MKIAPSILTADFSCLEAEIKSISKADMLHLDIMDGNFVPNISFGPHIISCLAKITKQKFDVHLMTKNPLDWIDKFNFKQTEYITVHVESKDFLLAIAKIKKLGLKVGLSLKPKTSINKIKPYLDMVDLVLVMSVEPGFGGQGFIKGAYRKIKLLNQLKIENNYHYQIEVDGGINDVTGKQCIKNGATILVAGSYVFNKKDRNLAIEGLKLCE